MIPKIKQSKIAAVIFERWCFSGIVKFDCFLRTNTHNARYCTLAMEQSAAEILCTVCYKRGEGKTAVYAHPSLSDMSVYLN